VAVLGGQIWATRPEMWMRLQATYDLKKSTQNRKIMARVARIVPLNPVEEARA